MPSVAGWTSFKRGPSPAAVAVDDGPRPVGNPALAAMAANYAASMGFSRPSFDGYADVDAEIQGLVADEYAKLPEFADDLGSRLSWAAFEAEVNAQFDFVRASGIDTPTRSTGDPFLGYKTAVDIAADLAKGRIYMELFWTARGYPFLDKVLTLHDVFGHSAAGYPFGPRGEYNAWLAHKQLFSSAALPAMTTRIRGFNAASYFGRHLYNVDGTFNAAAEHTTPLVKFAVLPWWCLIPTKELRSNMGGLA